MFYTGLMASMALLVGISWLLVSLFTKQPKRYPLLVVVSAAFLLFLATTIVPKAPSKLSATATMTQPIRNLTVQTKSTLAATFFASTYEKEYPYAKEATLSFYPDGSIRHVQLDVTDAWYTLSKEEKTRYADLLKSLAASFQTNGQLPFMQIHANQTVVARSSAQNTNSLLFFNE